MFRHSTFSYSTFCHPIKLSQDFPSGILGIIDKEIPEGIARSPFSRSDKRAAFQHNQAESRGFESRWTRIFSCWSPHLRASTNHDYIIYIIRNQRSGTNPFESNQNIWRIRCQSDSKQWVKLITIKLSYGPYCKRKYLFTYVLFLNL